MTIFTLTQHRPAYRTELAHRHDYQPVFYGDTLCFKCADEKCGSVLSLAEVKRILDNG